MWARWVAATQGRQYLTRCATPRRVTPRGVNIVVAATCIVFGMQLPVNSCNILQLWPIAVVYRRRTTH